VKDYDRCILNPWQTIKWYLKRIDMIRDSVDHPMWFPIGFNIRQEEEVIDQTLSDQ
jgi:hypothetical protein